MADDGRLITTAQAARLLGLHLRKVQRLIESGELPIAQKAGGRYLLDPQAVDAYRSSPTAVQAYRANIPA